MEEWIEKIIFIQIAPKNYQITQDELPIVEMVILKLNLKMEVQRK